MNLKVKKNKNMKKKNEKSQKKTQPQLQTRGIKLEYNKTKPQKKGGCC